MISLSAIYFLKCRSCITYYISIAYLCKTPNETRCLPGTLEALRADGVQIVILDSPEIYSEYAPYTYIEDMKKFIDKVTLLNRGIMTFDLFRLLFDYYSLCDRENSYELLRRNGS